MCCSSRNFHLEKIFYALALSLSSSAGRSVSVLPAFVVKSSNENDTSHHLHKGIIDQWFSGWAMWPPPRGPQDNEGKLRGCSNFCVGYRNFTTWIKYFKFKIEAKVPFPLASPPQHERLDCTLFLISNFRYVLSVVFWLLSDAPASEFYVLTFLITLSVAT
jgi:hypothetical protein